MTHAVLRRAHAHVRAGVTGSHGRRKAQRDPCRHRRRDALRAATSGLRGRSPDLRARHPMPRPSRLPMPAAQWRMRRPGRAYRCGGSAGLAVSRIATPASPASRFSPWTNVRGPPRSGCIVGRIARACLPCPEARAWTRRGAFSRRRRGGRGARAPASRLRPGGGWWSPGRRRDARAAGAAWRWPPPPPRPVRPAGPRARPASGSPAAPLRC